MKKNFSRFKNQISFLSMIFGLLALIFTAYQINETAKVQKATLMAQVLEKLENASEKEKEEGRRAVFVKKKWSCTLC